MEPSAGKREQQANTIDISQVEQQMACNGDQRDRPGRKPANAAPPREPDDCHSEQREERRRDQRMRDVAMPVEIRGRPPEGRNGVEIRDVRRQNHNRRRARSRMPESRPRKKQSNQRVRQVVQL